MAEWYYAQGGQQKGPVELAAIQQLLATGQIQPGDLVWNEKMPNWQPASTVADLAISHPVSYPAAPLPSVAGFFAPPPQYAPSPQYGAAPLEYGGGGVLGPSYQGLAIGGFACSLIGLLCIGYVLGPVGLALGWVALNGMKKGGNPSGRGLGIAAVIIGICALLIQGGLLVLFMILGHKR